MLSRLNKENLVGDYRKFKPQKCQFKKKYKWKKETVDLLFENGGLLSLHLYLLELLHFLLLSLPNYLLLRHTENFSLNRTYFALKNLKSCHKNLLFVYTRKT